LNALPAAGTVGVLAAKTSSARGWAMEVNRGGRLRGYVGGSGAVRPPVVVTTTGTVTETTDGNYKVLKFTGDGTLTVTAGDSIDAEVLVVGGGGGGSMGGGGAGGYLAGTELISGTMNVTVGAGGAGQTGGLNPGGSGSSSILGTRTALGGGGGAKYGASAPSGACGGGASNYSSGGTGTQGYNGGGGNGSWVDSSGGGGGVAAVGQNSVSASESGDGGAGLDNDIVLTGTNVGYGGGGGGGRGFAGTAGHATHGGGAGAVTTTDGTPGTANTGGGGGGSGSGGSGGPGGAGGTGIVVVRFPSIAAANCRQQTGATVMVIGQWYHATMTYAGSGGDIALYVNGVAESLTAAGAVGAHDSSNAGNLQLFKGDAAAYASAALGRVTAWARALSASEPALDHTVGPVIYNRSLAKGTVVISGTVRNRKGAPVPAHHVRAGWWIQNLAWQPDPAEAPPTLYITGHSVDLAGKKNALTIGIDWMEKEIGVRQAELLAIPPTVVPDPVVEDIVDPDTPDTPSEPSTPVKEPGATYQFRGGGTPTGRAGAPAGMEWVSAGEAKEPGGEWISQGEVLRPIGAKWDRNPYD